MNTRKIADWLTIATNLTVVLGILFLGYEIGQNTKQLRAQATYNLTQNRIALARERVVNPEFAEFDLRVHNAETLSDIDRERLRSMAFAAILNWQWEWGQVRDGNLPLDMLPVEAFRRTFHRVYGQYPAFKEVWAASKHTVSSDFGAWMKANIVDNPPPAD